MLLRSMLITARSPTSQCRGWGVCALPDPVDRRASPVDTSALMQQNSPPTLSKSPVPERETIPPQETLGGGDDNIDPVDPRESVTGSEEPGLPEAAVMRKDMAAVSNKDGLPTRKDDDEDATSEPTTKPCMY
ncbi:beta-1,2-xylosyltransferease XAX1 [Zea mays]|nr:beta-1,2-xylosyltransferease XAX1 [Zea mays]|eukprot:XP_020399985.1 uncharacterized protein LOC103639439 [Zea mays]